MTLGIELTATGARFTVRSKHATQVFVCLFDDKGEQELRRVPLLKNNDLHSALAEGVKPGQRYGLRADGPFDLERDHRFDPSKLLVDPYATTLDRPYTYHPDLGIRGRETAHLMPKAVVQTPHPKIIRDKPHSPKWIYELNIKAFTQRHPEIPDEIKGTVPAFQKTRRRHDRAHAAHGLD
jgi:glycogen debranching enzyme